MMQPEMWAAMMLGAWLGGAPPDAPDVATRLSLEWDAPASCPSAPEIRERIGAYLGRDEFGEELDDVRVQGRVQPAGKGSTQWALTLDIHLPEETIHRRVPVPRCDDARDAAALIIAVALDPLRVSRSAPPPIPPVTPAPSAPAPAPPSAPVRERFADLRLGGLMEVGAAPRVAGGLALEVAYVGPRVRVALTSRYLPPRVVRPFQTPSSAGVRVQTGLVGVRACFVPRVGRVELPACAQFDGGATRARGIELQTARVAHRAWLTVSLGQEVVWHSRRGLGVWLAADATATVLAPRFVIDDLGTVYAPGWAAFRLMGGPSARF